MLTFFFKKVLRNLTSTKLANFWLVVLPPQKKLMPLKHSYLAGLFSIKRKKILVTKYSNVLQM